MHSFCKDLLPDKEKYKKEKLANIIFGSYLMYVQLVKYSKFSQSKENLGKMEKAAILSFFYCGLI